jgi:hypothetical protein
MRTLPLAVVVAGVCTVASARPVPTVSLHVINVGQGHSSLIEFPCAAVPIDLGGGKNADFHGTAELLASAS